MKYYCRNKECKNLDKEIDVKVSNIKVVNGEVVTLESICTECNEVMEKEKIEKFNVYVKESLDSVNKNWSKPVKGKTLY